MLLEIERGIRSKLLIYLLLFIFILILSLFIIPSHLIRNRNIRVSLTVFEIPPLPMRTYREDIAQRRLINTLSRY